MQETEQHIYIAIDLKSFYASVECQERGLNPLTTNLVVADSSRTEKTICLAVSPSLKAYGISGRARLFEVVQKVKEINIERRRLAPHNTFTGTSYDDIALKKNRDLELTYIVAPPRMAYYMKYSTNIYNIYLKWFSEEDIYVYSIDEVFIDVTKYLKTYKMKAKELATKVVLDQIYFYDKFHPELFIKKGLFQNFEDNNGNISEFIIPLEINVNIEGINYNDNLNWDLLDIELIPETFAENTVKDENLPNKFILPIAYQIRKGIHNYVFNLFKNFVKNFEKYEQNYFLGEEKINKTTRKADDLGKNIPIFIFDAKLSQMLGKKRKINENMNEENLPSFLLNKKDDKNNNELKKIKKMMNSSTKKISNKKIKI